MSLVIDNSVILLAEDRADDVDLIRRAFKKANILNPLQVVEDGAEAVDYLKGEGKYVNRAEYPLPSLFLLDLKMPRMDGFEVLKWLRQEPGIRTLRVVVLTSSTALQDVNRAYELGANSFLVKPLEFERFVATVHAMEGYWLWMSEAPELFSPRSKQAQESSQFWSR